MTAAVKKRRTARTSRRAPDPQPVYKDWHEMARKNQFAKELIEVYRAHEKNSRLLDWNVARVTSHLRENVGVEQAREFLIGHFEFSPAEAEDKLHLTDTWETLNDQTLWAACGRRDVALLVTIQKKHDRDEIVKLVLDEAALRADKQVSRRFVRNLVEQRNVKISGVEPPVEPVDEPQTKTQEVITLGQSMAVVKQLKDLIAREPSLAGNFTPEAIETIEKL